MDFTLAKKLKDAGFPCERLHYVDSEDSFMQRNAPSLDELIHECNWRFEGLQRGIMTQDNGEPWWYAKSRVEEKIDSDGEIFEGETPEIAVANLYLSLHE